MADNSQAASKDSSPLPPGVDWSFIAAREGASLNGYVPSDRNGNPSSGSGVTIGIGFDLGGRIVADLQALMLSQDLIDALTPYLQRRGRAAEDFVHDNPLAITSAQEQQLDAASFNHYYDAVAGNYNAAAHGIRFQDLPQEAQTAIVSVAYQYGTNLAGATPNFWNQIVNGRWHDAYANLMNFGDAYPSRRHLEAQLLKKAIDAGTLPPSG